MRRIRTFSLLTMVILVAGCGKGGNTVDKPRLVRAYSDLVVTRTRDGAKSKSYDSVLKSYNYESEKELVDELKSLGKNQDELRVVLDSIQSTIQRRVNNNWR